MAGTSAQRLGRARMLTRADGRDRIAVPFWNGVLSFLGSLAIGFGCMFAALIVALFAVVLATGHEPSLNPGHPLAAFGEVVFYGAAGCFAAWRLRRMNRPLLQRFAGSDWRALGLGLLALLLVRIGMVIQLVLTHQTKHVQNGFEHFSMVTSNPLLTALTMALSVFVLVVLGPLVEEIAFRGLLFGALARSLGVIGAAVITALVFGAVHGDPVLFPTLAALGLISALAYATTANLSVSVLLHATNNALGATVLVVQALRAH